MLYNLLKPILFAADAELAHEVSLEMLNQFQMVLQLYVQLTSVDYHLIQR